MVLLDPGIGIQPATAAVQQVALQRTHTATPAQQNRHNHVSAV